MSDRNDNSASMGLAIVGVMAAMLFLMIYAIAAFLTVVMTLYAFYAWNTPRTAFGETTYPEEARAFVFRGCAGAIILPVFAGFVEVLFEYPIDEQFWPHLAIIGYILGSLGVGILIEQEKEKAQFRQEINPPVKRLPQPTPPALPQHHAKPFQFGSWDDEEEQK